MPRGSFGCFRKKYSRTKTLEARMQSGAGTEATRVAAGWALKVPRIVLRTGVIGK